MTSKDSMPTTDDLLVEFMIAYGTGHLIPKDIDAIIILTADGNEYEMEEITSRICRALVILKKLSRRIPVIFNGVDEERKSALESMKSFGVPEDLIHFQSCGIRGVANTKTQLETIARDTLTRNMRKIAFVTSTYHIPRTRRTAGKYLSPDTTFVVSSDLSDYTINNTFLEVIGEIQRIKKYAQKGYILAWPR